MRRNYYSHPFAGQFQIQSNEHKSNQHHTGSQGTGTDRDCLKELEGKNVKINRGGPESFEGKLLSVQSDYLVVRTKQGIVYTATAHVKSIAEEGNCHSSGGRTSNFIKAANFRGVLRALNQEFVQVNMGGPEKQEGFLAEVCRDSIKLVNGRQVVQVLIDHIKTIKKESKSCGSQGNRTGGSSENTNNNNNNKSNKSNGSKNKNENKNENKNKSGNKNKNRSSSGGNNRTGGARTGGNSSSGGKGKSNGKKSGK